MIIVFRDLEVNYSLHILFLNKDLIIFRSIIKLLLMYSSKILLVYKLLTDASSDNIFEVLELRER